MNLAHYSISRDNASSNISFHISEDDVSSLQDVMANIAQQVASKTRRNIVYNITKETPAALTMGITEFAVIEPYLRQSPEITLEDNILKRYVEQLVADDEIDISAGLITNSRTNSTMASMMLSKSFDIPIRHVVFDCPTHCEGEIWAKIIENYDDFRDTNPDQNGAAKVIWRAHAERLTDKMFESLSDMTEHVAIYTRNPNLVLESIIRGRVLDMSESTGNMIGVLAANLDGTLSEHTLNMLSPNSAQHENIQSMWNDYYPENTRDGVLALLDIYASNHSECSSWSALRDSISKTKDYSVLDGIITIAYDELKPDSPYELPSALHYPMRDPFGFSEKSYQKQLDFLHARQERGQSVIAVDASSLRTIDEIRTRFGNAMGVPQDELLVDNIQAQLKSNIAGNIPEESAFLIGNTLKSDEIIRVNKPLLPTGNFPESTRHVLDRELPIYSQQMANPAASGPKNVDELERVIYLDTSEPIHGRETTTSTDPHAMINVDPLSCLIMAEHCYRNTMDPDALAIVNLLQERLEQSVYADQAALISNHMSGPKSTYLHSPSHAMQLGAPELQQAI